MKQEARIKSEREKDSEFSSWQSACLLFRGRGMTKFMESVLVENFPDFYCNYKGIFVIAKHEHWKLLV